MKRIAAFIMMLVSVLSYAQSQSEMLERRYNLIVSQVGQAGLGVETVLNSWEKVDSTNLKMLLGKFNYYFTKAQTTNIVAKQEKKYLGCDPILTLKDSLGRDVYYFQDVEFDDESYGKALKVVNKVIALNPDRLDLKFMKANAFLEYEKGSPDMTLNYLMDLSDVGAARTTDWKFAEETKDKKFFQEAMQEYCYNLFAIATPSSREAFMKLSTKLNKLFPSNNDFLNNIGSYYLVNSDFKSALKIFSKVLKKQPDNLTAIQNSVLASRFMKDSKSEIKYLQMMVKYAPANEALTAKARIEVLNKK